jgi:membrane associated rhomboid family serine protease
MERDYASLKAKPHFLWGSPFTISVVAINALIFLILFFIPERLMLDLVGLGQLKVESVLTNHQYWTFLTYGFIQYEPGHFFMNMLVFGIIGSMVERAVGSRRFGLFYITTIVGVGVITFTYHYILGIPQGLIGASGGVYGVLLAYAVFKPFSKIYIFGVIPVSSKYYVLFWGAVSAYNIITNSNPGVSEYGAFVGYCGSLDLYPSGFQNNPWEIFFGRFSRQEDQNYRR